jgi:hypothetical protein
MSQLQDLRARLRLDDSEFKRGISGAKGQATGLGGALKSALLPVAAALTAAFSARALFGGMMRGGAEIDQVAKSARALGASIGGFRALEMAAGEAGVAVETLRDQSINLERAMATGKADASLRALGLEAKALGEMDVDQRFAAISDRVQELGLSGGETAALLRNLGITNRDMTLALMQGGDAFRKARQDVKDYGLELSQVDSDKIEAANDAIGRTALVGQYLRQTLATALLPAMGDLSRAFTDSLREGGLLRGMIDTLGSGLRSFVDALRFVSDNARTFGVVLSALAATQIPGLVTSLFAGVAAMGTAATAATTLTGIMRGLGLALTLAGGPWSIFAAVIGATLGYMVLFREETTNTVGPIDQAKSAIDSLNAAMAGFVTASATGQAESIKNAQGHRIQAQAAIEAARAEILLMKAEAERFRNAPMEERGLLGDMTDKTLSANIDLAAQELSRLERLADDADRRIKAAVTRITGGTVAAGKPLSVAIPAATLPEIKIPVAVSGASAARKEIDSVSDSIRKATTASEQWADKMAGHFDGLITGGKGLSGVLQSMARQLESEGWKMLFKGLGGGGGGGGGLFSWLGGLIGIGKNANGTPNWRGGLSVVGERGAEIVNLPRGAQVFDAQTSAGMMRRGATGGGMNVSIGFDASVGGFTALIRDEAGRVVAQAAPAIVGQAVGATYDRAARFPIPGTGRR